METADAVTGELDRVDEAVGTGTDESRELHGLEGLIARIAGSRTGTGTPKCSNGSA
jgi:hypothetical protein